MSWELGFKFGFTMKTEESMNGQTNREKLYYINHHLFFTNRTLLLDRACEKFLLCCVTSK